MKIDAMTSSGHIPVGKEDTFRKMNLSSPSSSKSHFVIFCRWVLLALVSLSLTDSSCIIFVLQLDWFTYWSCFPPEAMATTLVFWWKCPFASWFGSLLAPSPFILHHNQRILLPSLVAAVTASLFHTCPPVDEESSCLLIRAVVRPKPTTTTLDNPWS